MFDRISRINRIDGVYGIDSSLKTSEVWRVAGGNDAA